MVARSVVLETPRLVLRRMTLADLAFVTEMLTDGEVMRFYGRQFTREDAEGWLARQLERYERDGTAFWLAADRASGAPVGQVGLLRRELDGAREFEVAYLIHRPFWRRGYASEAAVATRDHAFGALGLPRVISLVRPENVPSRGVAEKMGMTVERETDWSGMRHLVYAVRAAALAP